MSGRYLAAAAAVCFRAHQRDLQVQRRAVPSRSLAAVSPTPAAIGASERNEKAPSLGVRRSTHLRGEPRVPKGILGCVPSVTIDNEHVSDEILRLDGDVRPFGIRELRTKFSLAHACAGLDGGHGEKRSASVLPLDCPS
eukprot:SAG31_NODE_3909_length_3762_cov_2.740923_5_plen_139_part_00